ncbi:MAG: NAD(P)/FAD-dependent oxidoreductase [Deltaproteobacteria bacterium]|nr:NAD(P)/FAD-dependent oxidoreductase [Deltaproteobacteria bacterium]MBW2418801.1 NAD(P)/FAD-dependent oxidoreductase [Deltaproteobacteria bacterium]
MSEAKSSARESFDAIVVGSGLGGLCTAAYLCASGRRTLVLEGHYIAGGNSQVFRRKHGGREFEFDVGIHYIGECGRDGSITAVLNGVGLAERVIFRPLDSDGYSNLHLPDFSFRIPFGWDRYRARLLETFPGEHAGLTPVLDVMQGVAEASHRLGRGELDFADMADESPIFLQWGLRPVTELFAEHRISDRAATVLLGEQGCYAVRPSETPVVMAAGLTDHFLRGAYYPVGGGQVIAARLVEAIRAYGGEVRTQCPVQRIRVEKGRVLGVVAGKKNQRPMEIDAPVVVSGADLKRTFSELVGEEHWAPESLERVRSLEMAVPLFCAYLMLDVDLADLGMTNSNHFILGDYDLEGIYDELDRGEISSKAMCYLTAASLKDPASRNIAPAGYTNLQIMTLVPRSYDVWGVERGPAEGGRYHRDPEYRKRKNALMDQLIQSSEQLIPDLRKHIVWKEAATPVSQERFTHSTGGTSYGVEMSCSQVGPMRVGPRTEIEGLFLCGASTPSGPGISGVMRGGVATAAEVLETDLLKPILAGEVFGDRSALPELREDWDAWRESH